MKKDLIGYSSCEDMNFFGNQIEVEITDSILRVKNPYILILADYPPHKTKWVRGWNKSLSTHRYIQSRLEEKWIYLYEILL